MLGGEHEGGCDPAAGQHGARDGQTPHDAAVAGDQHHAVANAISIRVHDYPITLNKLIAQLPAVA